MLVIYTGNYGNCYVTFSFSYRGQNSGFSVTGQLPPLMGGVVTELRYRCGRFDYEVDQ